jgi:hypothetical protein
MDINSIPRHYAAYDHACAVVAQLTGDLRASALTALRLNEDAKRVFPSDQERALSLVHEACERFAEIPQARYLLAITKADIGTMHGAMGDWHAVIAPVREAIQILSTSTEFVYTLGSANMNLGTALCHEGKRAAGKKCFDEARRLFRLLPSGEKWIDLTNRNEASFDS